MIPYTGKIGKDCLPNYFEQNQISSYGIKYKKNSKIEQCINLYIPALKKATNDSQLENTTLFLGFFAVKELSDDNFFITGSNRGSPLTKIGKIHHMAYFVSNCAIVDKVKLDFCSTNSGYNTNSQDELGQYSLLDEWGESGLGAKSYKLDSNWKNLICEFSDKPDQQKIKFDTNR